MLNLDISKEDAELIRAIVGRVLDYCLSSGLGIYVGPDRLSMEIDLVVCHLNGCPLNLEGLRWATLPDLAHDIEGIDRHLNRKTGQLEGGFKPRYATLVGDFARSKGYTVEELKEHYTDAENNPQSGWVFRDSEGESCEFPYYTEEEAWAGADLEAKEEEDQK